MVVIIPFLVVVLERDLRTRRKQRLGVKSNAVVTLDLAFYRKLKPAQPTRNQSRELRAQRIGRGGNCLGWRQDLVTQIATLHELFSAEPSQAAFGRFRSGLQGPGNVAPSLFLQMHRGSRD